MGLSCKFSLNPIHWSQWISGLVSRQVHFWWFLQMSLLPYVAMTTWDQHPNRNETSGLRSTLKVVAVNLQPASRSNSWGAMGQTVCRAAHVLFYPVTGIRVSIFRHIPKWRGKELLRVSQPQIVLEAISAWPWDAPKTQKGLKSVFPKAGTIQHVFASSPQAMILWLTPPTLQILQMFRMIFQDNSFPSPHPCS